MTRAWNMTRHAAMRIQDMCIPPSVVRDILENPERTYDDNHTMSRRTPNGPRRMYCKGKVALLVATEERMILTALWAGPQKWSREDLDLTWKDGGWIDY